MAYSRALESLESQRMSGTLAEDDLERKLLGVFEQACLFHLQAGYTERAFACYQALIEINLFCPAHLERRPFRERLLHLKKFWEGPSPRFGEPGAKGWANTITIPSPADHAPPPSIENEEIKFASGMLCGLLCIRVSELTNTFLFLIETGPSVLEKWAKIEALRENHAFLSFNVAREGDLPEDPDRVTPFEDLEENLMQISTAAAKEELLFMFLNFVGIPANFHGSLRHSLRSPEGWWKVRMEDFENMERVFPEPNAPVSVESLFPAYRPQLLPSIFLPLSPANRETLSLEFSRACLAHATSLATSKSVLLQAVSLAFEARIDSKS